MTDAHGPALPPTDGAEPAAEAYEADDCLVVQSVGRMSEWIKSSEWVTDPDATPADEYRWEAVEAELEEDR